MSSFQQPPSRFRSTSSAHIEMRLSIDGRVVQIAQLGPDFLILKNRASTELPPSEGWIEVSIDGKTRRWPVRLPAGAAPCRDRTPMVSLLA